MTGSAPGPRGHRLGRAAVAVPMRAAAGLGSSPRGRPTDALPPPLDAEVLDLSTPAGRVALYAAGPDRPSEVRPLLLLHSVNAAATAYEIKPIFDHYRAMRPVYAIDLPGYGLSDRPRRAYTPRVMTDAVLAALDAVRARHGDVAVDALAVSLSSEFLARAAAERPDAVRAIALVSPTGFDSRGPRNGPAETTRGKPWLLRGFTVPLWRGPFYRMLTSRVSIRYFLEKTWGSKAIDEGLFAYDLLTTRQPGAEHAPYAFISGFLFSADISRVYASLRLPVWLVHGTRGDFVDYAGTSRIAALPNWTVDAMPTGALPQFEQMAALAARMDAVLAEP